MHPLLHTAPKPDIRSTVLLDSARKNVIIVGGYCSYSKLALKTCPLLVVSKKNCLQNALNLQQ